MDMKTVLEKTRYLAEVEPGKEKSKRGTKKELVLTDEDIERSLSAIKSGLATVSEGQDTVQDKYKEIESEMKQL